MRMFQTKQDDNVSDDVADTFRGKVGRQRRDAAGRRVSAYNHRMM